MDPRQEKIFKLSRNFQRKLTKKKVNTFMKMEEDSENGQFNPYLK